MTTRLRRVMLRREGRPFPSATSSRPALWLATIASALVHAKGDARGAAPSRCKPAPAPRGRREAAKARTRGVRSASFAMSPLRWNVGGHGPRRWLHALARRHATRGDGLGVCHRVRLRECEDELELTQWWTRSNCNCPGRALLTSFADSATAATESHGTGRIGRVPRPETQPHRRQRSAEAAALFPESRRRAPGRRNIMASHDRLLPPCGKPGAPAPRPRSFTVSGPRERQRGLVRSCPSSGAEALAARCHSCHRRPNRADLASAEGSRSGRAPRDTSIR